MMVIFLSVGFFLPHLLKNTPSMLPAQHCCSARTVCPADGDHAKLSCASFFKSVAGDLHSHSNHRLFVSAGELLGLFVCKKNSPRMNEPPQERRRAQTKGGLKTFYFLISTASSPSLVSTDTALTDFLNSSS